MCPFSEQKFVTNILQIGWINHNLLEFEIHLFEPSGSISEVDIAEHGSPPSFSHSIVFLDDLLCSPFLNAFYTDATFSALAGILAFFFLNENYRDLFSYILSLFQFYTYQDCTLFNLNLRFFFHFGIMWVTDNQAITLKLKLY